MNKYQSYKSSGEDWIGEIPNEWEILKIKHCVNPLRKITYGIVQPGEEDPNGKLMIRGKDYSNGWVDTSLVFKVSEKVELPYKRSRVKTGDIVYTIVGGLGNCEIVPDEYDGSNLTQTTGRISVNEKTSNKFLYYFLKSRLNELQLGFTHKGSVLPGISLDTLSNFIVIRPPLSEQNQIVQFLDEKTEKIDKLISLKERKIILLKEQRTSLINQIISKGLNPNVKMKESGVEWIGEIPNDWEIGRLGYYSNVYRGSGYQYLNQVDEFYNGRKEKVVRISDITEFNPIWCEYLEQFENYRIKKDEILIGGTGHYFGKSIYVTEEMEGLIHSYNIIRLVVKEQYSKYIQYYISSPMIREQLDMSVLGSGQPFIDLQGLKDLTILIPKYKEQIKIVEYLDSKTKEIYDLVQLEQKKIDLLKEYRQSLISEVVTGKIKVTTDE
jgi:type I restriction enzyme S subunit